jgi:hypothetical protein
MAEVKIIVDRETYKVTIEGVGFTGQGCLSEIEKITRALQAQTIKRTPKPEMFYVSKGVIKR